MRIKNMRTLQLNVVVVLEFFFICLLSWAGLYAPWFWLKFVIALFVSSMIMELGYIEIELRRRISQRKKIKKEIIKKGNQNA